MNIYDPQIEEESSEEGSMIGVESSKEVGSGQKMSSQNDEKNAKETSEAEKTVLYDTISAGDNYTVFDTVDAVNVMSIIGQLLPQATLTQSV